MLLIVAAVVGDAVNYWIGYRLGPAVFRREDSRLLNKKHLLQAQEFYEKYGGKTIILARFVPIVRTFAPFVAGVGQDELLPLLAVQRHRRVAWVLICLLAGYFLGSIPLVKKHFELVIVLIVVISVLPMAFEFWQARRAAAARQQSGRAGGRGRGLAHDSIAGRFMTLPQAGSGRGRRAG